MKLKWLAQSKKWALGCAYASLGVLVAYGLLSRTSSSKPKIPTQDPPIFSGQQQGNVKVRANLSQTKVVQGSDGLVYLQVDLEAPDKARSKERRPTDFVVVLDRSGSMGDAKKMDYAHRAIESLVRQLNPADRFGLVTFDDSIETPLELGSVTEANKESVISKIRAITPRGSTNLGGGLMAGIQLIRSNQKNERADRLILVSDGIANVGVTSPQELGRIASQAAQGEFAVSTIGVGLDFNETLMSTIADHGNGNYHFLENLASLEKVLAQEFYGASQVYASELNLKLNLAPGVEVVEASGYPISRDWGSTIVRAGHLYGGQKRTFFVTLRLPTDRVYSSSLGEAFLSYQVEGKPFTVSLFKEDLKIACVSVERKQEALSSIVPGVYKEAWTKNNFGRFLKENSERVGKGDEAGALSAIKDYKAKLSTAYQAAPAPEMKKQMEELDQMEGEVGSAFSSADRDTSLKRLGKTYQYQGIQNQRKSN